MDLISRGYKINGDLGKVYKAINDVALDVREVKTRQKDNHVANQRDIARLYKWMWALTFLILSASVTVTLTAIAG